MKATIGRNWRDSASLILLAKRKADVGSSQITENSNYEILLQTRSQNSSFANSVVFPGGVSEEADTSENWLQYLKSFGYNQQDFEKLHKAGSPVTPIFADNPVRRHISLRITAIRETFEELGILICSKDSKDDKTEEYANIISDVDIKYWQKRVSDDPSQLLNLCKEHSCYPDIWSLQYWSNWLSPPHLPKRFDTAFFITKIHNKPHNIYISSEVNKIQWSNPKEIIQQNKESVILFPPQIYEFHRLSTFTDIDKLISFAKERSCYSDELLYPVLVRVKDGSLFLFPGDHLYPSNVDYNHNKIPPIDKTFVELRDPTKILHRLEALESQAQLVFQNYTPAHHINMGNKILPLKARIN